MICKSQKSQVPSLKSKAKPTWDFWDLGPGTFEKSYYEKNYNFKFIGFNFRGLRRRGDSAEHGGEPANRQYFRRAAGSAGITKQQRRQQ